MHKNGFRIALLGDSFTEAIHVKLEDTHGAIIEQNLHQCPVLKDRKVEIMNFGVQLSITIILSDSLFLTFLLTL